MAIACQAWGHTLGQVLLGLASLTESTVPRLMPPGQWGHADRLSVALCCRSMSAGADPAAAADVWWSDRLRQLCLHPRGLAAAILPVSATVLIKMFRAKLQLLGLCAIVLKSKKIT